VTRKRIAASTEGIIAGAIGNLLLNPMTPYARQLVHEVARDIPYR
jgi:predicted RNA-binding protein Jag